MVSDKKQMPAAAIRPRLSLRRIGRRRVSRSLGGNMVLLLVLIFMGLFMLVPMLYVINNAFKPVEELFLFPPRIFVQNPTFNNFINLSGVVDELGMPLARYLFNTLFLTVVSTAAQVLLSSLCAYSLAKIPFPGARFVFRLIVLSLMFSQMVVVVPRYIIMSKLGLIDTYWAMIIPTFGSTIGLYLMKQFLENSVPDSLLEASRIDGASELRIFFQIVMPLLKPAWLTLIIFVIQSLWNTAGNNGSFFTYSEIYKTLPLALDQITKGGLSRTGIAAAVTLLMMLVPLGTFIVTQSNMLETMGSSGMKD